jgi:hypothetical protein
MIDQSDKTKEVEDLLKAVAPYIVEAMDKYPIPDIQNNKLVRLKKPAQDETPEMVRHRKHRNKTNKIQKQSRKKNR